MLQAWRRPANVTRANTLTTKYASSYTRIDIILKWHGPFISNKTLVDSIFRIGNFISDSLISAAFIGPALILWTFQIDFIRSTFKESTPNKYWRVLARVYQRQPFVTHRLNGLKRNSCKMLYKVPYQRKGGRKYLFRKLVKTELSKVLRTRGKLGGVKYKRRSHKCITLKVTRRSLFM